MALRPDRDSSLSHVVVAEDKMYNGRHRGHHDQPCSGDHGHSHEHGHGHSHAPRNRQNIRTISRLRAILEEVRRTLLHPDSRRITALLLVHVASLVIQVYYESQTNSLALSAFTYVSWFHLMGLLTCYLTLWIRIVQKSKSAEGRKASTSSKHTDVTGFSLGHARLEVLAVFSSTVLTQLAATFILKESVERLLESPDIHTGRLVVGALVGLGSHLMVTFLAPHTALTHVMEVSSSSWLQEHMADLAHSVCNVIPMLSPYLLPRINPMVLLSGLGFAIIFIMDAIIEINNSHSVDSFLAIAFSCLILGTMIPMSVYTGKILLQTVPGHVVPQLDRFLREALTIDGVLEFKNEHFWTVSFGKLAGSLVVRIRRDADDQQVQTLIISRLSSIVWPLTIQICRDDYGVSRANLAASKGKPTESPAASSSAMVSPGISPVNGLYPAYNTNHAAVISPAVSSQPGSLSFKTSTPKDGVNGAISTNGHSAGPTAGASSGSYQHWSLDGSQGAVSRHGATPVATSSNILPPRPVFAMAQPNIMQRANSASLLTPAGPGVQNNLSPNSYSPYYGTRNARVKLH